MATAERLRSEQACRMRVHFCEGVPCECVCHRADAWLITPTGQRKPLREVPLEAFWRSVGEFR